MNLGGYIFSTVIAAATVMALPTGSAHAQYIPNISGIIGGGGRINPGAAINMGVGILQDAHRQHQKAVAAERERARVAELQKTKAGRAQLAKERANARKQAQAQARFVNGRIGAAALGAIGGGGGGGGGTGGCDGRGGTWYRDQISGQMQCIP